MKLTNNKTPQDPPRLLNKILLFVQQNVLFCWTRTRFCWSNQHFVHQIYVIYLILLSQKRNFVEQIRLSIFCVGQRLTSCMVEWRGSRLLFPRFVARMSFGQPFQSTNGNVLYGFCGEVSMACVCVWHSPCWEMQNPCANQWFSKGFVAPWRCSEVLLPELPGPDSIWTTFLKQKM